MRARGGSLVLDARGRPRNRDAPERSQAAALTVEIPGGRAKIGLSVKRKSAFPYVSRVVASKDYVLMPYASGTWTYEIVGQFVRVEW